MAVDFCNLTGVETQLKACTRCGLHRPITNFHLRRLDGRARASWCIECTNSRQRARQASLRQARGTKPLGIVISCAKCGGAALRRGAKQRYCRTCSPIVQREQIKAWNKENADRVNARRKESRDPDRQREYERRWVAKNRATVNKAERARMADPKRRLDKNMSRAIRKALATGKSGKSWETLVGYSLFDLIEHIERQFLPGMSWENYGDWHIDHVLPKAAFNYTAPEHVDFRRAWSIKNLQPLWAVDNRKKSDTLDRPFQPSLAL